MVDGREGCDLVSLYGKARFAPLASTLVTGHGERVTKKYTALLQKSIGTKPPPLSRTTLSNKEKQRITLYYSRRTRRTFDTMRVITAVCPPQEIEETTASKSTLELCRTRALRCFYFLAKRLIAPTRKLRYLKVLAWSRGGYCKGICILEA